MNVLEIIYAIVGEALLYLHLFPTFINSVKSIDKLTWRKA
jgi:hypothetical protein